MAALNDLSATFTRSLTVTGKITKTGKDYKPVTNSLAFTTPTVEIKKSIANAQAGGGDQCLSALYTIAASGTVTIDLTSFTDLMERSGGSFARIKYAEFHLLSTDDGDPLVTVNASSVTIGNAGANPHQLFLGGDTHTIVLESGDLVCWGTRKPAGRVVDGSNKNVLVTNNDGTNSAYLKVTVVGGST